MYVEDRRPQPLPLGRSDFAGLRLSGAVYVDKTGVGVRAMPRQAQYSSYPPAAVREVFARDDF